MDSNTIRSTFLEFFREKGHKIVPSAPMVVKNDPTLMFTNAGMNPFKDIFLGNDPITSSRVADTQKCLRVSGKHNDLDEVGHDTYHHTMFEMLGNWSFGDYFKKEAIDWAWELLTEVFKLPKDRLYATVFEGSPDEGVAFDAEAYELWKQYLPEDHIILGNRKDNFWEMGDTGPCGPCSEIHYDLRSEEERRQIEGRDLVNAGHHLVIEIWNLVFMQFNRKANGSLEPLAHTHVDTGMGFERLCMAIQGKESNYDTDVFQGIIGHLAQMSGTEYGKEVKTDIALRVIADHLRAISFSIADGQLPSNVKAGYVIRRILRRAVRYGYTYLGFRQPFMYQLVPVLVAQMGHQFPELKAQQELICKVMQEEESSFLHTLSTGITLLDTLIAKIKKEGRNVIDGKNAFLLYDTYGFPYDLTELIAREQNMLLDKPGFDQELENQKTRSRNAAAIETDDWVQLLPDTESRFVGYDTTEADVRIVKYRKITAKNKTFYQLVFDQTPFYGNSGGQVGDRGWLISGDEKTEINDTLKDNNLTVHIVSRLPEDVSTEFLAKVDSETRTATANNHTATHLLQSALVKVLGNHVEQKGSLVNPNGLRFDFSHFQKMTEEEIYQVEKLVNREIRANRPLEEHRECPIDQAKNMGATMLFGEKYGEKVRVVKYGDSIEFCGGTHVAATGQIGFFKIVSEGAISAGVRRIEAVTGERAEDMVLKFEKIIKETQRILNTPSVIQSIEKLIAENSDLSKKIDEAAKAQVKAMKEEIIKSLERFPAASWFCREIRMPADRLRDLAFALRQEVKDLVFIAGSSIGGKPTLVVALGDEIVARGISASDIVREAAKTMQGGGGGQPYLATAGGKDADKLAEAIQKAGDLVREKLNG